MAQQRKLDEDEFWLPSEFLTDDDLLMDYGSHAFGAQPRCGFNSDLSSPVESPNGYTESDSEEEEYVSGMARCLRKPSLQSADLHPAKGRKLYGSPQSALSGYGFSTVASPTEEEPAVGWDLLYQAAEEFARMKVAEEIAWIQSRKCIPKPQKPTLPSRNACPVPSFYLVKSQNDARLAYLQLQAAQFQRMKQLQLQHVMKRRILAKWSPEFYIQNSSTPLSAARLPETWPCLQQSAQQRRVNINAFPAENAGVKKERNGTGVFFPRRNATAGPPASESRKKPAGRLLPGKLNPTPAAHSDPHPDTRVNNIPNLRSFPSATCQDLRLPQEWSY